MKLLDRLLRRSPLPPVRVTIETDAISVHAADGQCIRTPTTAATFEHDLAHALQPLGDASIAVSFDASAAHFDLLRWNAELTSGKRWQQFALARMARAGDALHWTIRVLRELPPRAALSAALPTPNLEALKKMAVRLACVRIDLLDRINALLERDRFYSGCVVDISAERAWIFVVRAGVIERVRLRRIASADDADGDHGNAETRDAAALLPILTSEWAATGDERDLPAIALAGSRAASAAVALNNSYAGNVIALTHRQPHGRFAIDFARARAPVPTHGWALAAVGVLAFAAAIASSAGDWQQRATSLAARERVQTALAAAQPAPSTASARRDTSSATARARETQTEAQLVALELRRPWGALFSALESSSNERVRIVQMDVDSRFRQLQIHAEAKSLGELIRYAEHLASIAPVNNARLAHHELKTVAGARIVSARLVARLDPSADAAAVSAPSIAHSSEPQLAAVSGNAK